MEISIPLLVPAQFRHELAEACARFHINTPLRLAHFLAQTAHESAGYSTTVENLNYSAFALANTWRNRFASRDAAGELIRDRHRQLVPNELAKTIARQPERIANVVYADRMGNGNEASGDGWKHRGAGLIQLTGKANQAAYSSAVYGDDRVVVDPSLLQKPHDAALSAGWYWDSKHLNRKADENDLVAITRAIQGAGLGLADRTAWLVKFKNALGVK